MRAEGQSGRDWRSIRETALLAGVFLLPLACWPNLQHPFSTPKTWLLALLGGMALLIRKPGEDGSRGPLWPWLAWPAAAAVSTLAASYSSAGALLLAVLPLPLGWSIGRGALSERKLRGALLWGAAAEAAIASLQYAGADPLQLLGWRPEVFAGARMRVYGTMGNPDFVAAWLAATLPLWAAQRESSASRWRWAGLALHLAGLFATGSRVSLLALPAAAAVLSIRERRLRRWWLACLPLAAALLFASSARPLKTTVEGRLYLARIAAGRWREVPLVGFGPGAWRLEFPDWQTEWLKQRGTGSGAVRFAGMADRAHNDFLEFWIEYGAAGLGAFLALSGWLLVRAWRSPHSGIAAGAWGGVAALCAAALVDFPFHRPAEWGLYWLFLGMLAVAPGCRRTQSTLADTRRKMACPRT